MSADFYVCRESTIDFYGYIDSILDDKGNLIVTNDGSNFNSMLEVMISQEKQDRLAFLDYKNTNTEAMTSILNDKKDNKIERMMQAVQNNYIVHSPVNTELTIDTDKALNEAAPDLYGEIKLYTKYNTAYCSALSSGTMLLKGTPADGALLYFNLLILTISDL
ncbi:hypothetical protein SAMN02745213_01937 [Succinivibrio dextrinosolvens DSM 3072]|uniref:Uncharacterized protein n=1 Tax=Succinivibrio dextrinosolvens DSM 3072 TaxID=1123324 RepID=A0A1T4VR25_9GAMM|nr:hypothetical protein [Succinivibrio dextrinosolvens]SKA67308.1 hypothetical protein SAMN02745213_01937 [Succinivibrio dextrinosolvens DSM 3072]